MPQTGTNRSNGRVLEDRADTEKLRGLNIQADGNLDRVGTVTQELTPSKLAGVFREAESPGDLDRLFEIYEKIEAYDGKIKGLVEKRRKAPTRFPTQFKVTDKDHPRASEVAEFVERVFKDISTKKLMRKTMNGILHGVHLMENVWMREGDYIVAKDPISISSSRYGQKNEMMGTGRDPNWGKIFVKTGMGIGEEFLIDNVERTKIFKAIYKDKRGFYDLTGVMRPLCKWYLFKYFASQYWIEYDETYGFPTTVITVPKSDYTEFKNELEEFLQNVGRNKFGILFDGMEYEVHAQQANGQVDVFRELIKYANKEIIYCITGQDLTEGGSQGSYAESVVGYDMETDLIIDDAEFVDSCINKNIIEPMIGFNFKDVPKDLVKFYTNTPERKDWQKLTKKWELAAKLGMKGVSKSQIQEELEIEFAEDEEDSVDLFWQPKPNTGGEHPPAEEREREDGGSEAEE